MSPPRSFNDLDDEEDFDNGNEENGQGQGDDGPGDEGQEGEGGADDDGDEGDGEGAPEGQGSSGQGDDEGGQVRQSRSGSRIQRLNERYRRAEEERQALLRQNQELTQRVLNGNQQPTQREETDAERQARYNALPPEQRFITQYNEDRQRDAQERQRLAFQLADSNDKADFYRNLAPNERRHADKVEQVLREVRGAGQNFTRDRILTFIMGEEARNNSRNNGANKGQRQQAANRVQRQQVSGGSSRSNVTGGRGRQPVDEREARRQRLENVHL